MFSKQKQTNPGNSIHKILWLTDTFDDHNGVSMVLKSMHHEIKFRNLPIDMLVCSDTIQPDDNLIVIKPVSEFHLPLYRQQPFRIPNFLQIQRIVKKNKYDCVICSTEGPMGLAAIYIKKVIGIMSVFYLHTDWMMFAKQVLKFEEKGLTRLQKLMRIYYSRFDKIFVLNTDQFNWLTGDRMRFNPSNVFLTAHWVDAIFTKPSTPFLNRAGSFRRNPVLLYAGRLSPEKGIFELPDIFRNAQKEIPDLRMRIAGSGPSGEELKSVFPEAEFTGWINHEDLPKIYHSADLLILPSRFDTFSCVVLEALSCGLPVVAYNTKGPKDIINSSETGFLCETSDEMSRQTIHFFKDPSLMSSFKTAAIKRAAEYSADKIIGQMADNLELELPETTNVAATA